MGDLWYVGVLLEIVSTMSGTIGKQLIRLSEVTKKTNPWLSVVVFRVGLLTNVAVGPIIDTTAYSFAPQSLIAPFGGLDVVWNALLAPYVLGEKLTCRRLVGAVLIFAGTSMAGAFGNHDDKTYTLQMLEDILINVRVGIYFAAFFVWFLFNRFYLLRFPEGSCIRGIALGWTAGTIAGNMFCVKAAVELVKTSVMERDGEIWTHWLPYVLLVGAVFFAVTNVIYMTQGLQEYEALFMVTLFEGSMIVSGCVSGAVVLLDMSNVEPYRIGLYSLGVLIVVLGMYVAFSQEAMSKSSLMNGTASIVQPEEDQKAAMRKSLTLEQVTKKRSVYSACPPSPHGQSAADGEISIARTFSEPDLRSRADTPDRVAGSPVRAPLHTTPSSVKEGLDPLHVSIDVLNDSGDKDIIFNTLSCNKASL